MESSILTSTKKVLGLSKDYTAFDEDIIMHINATFSILSQLGLGQTGSVFMIEDDSTLWEEIPIPTEWLNLLKTYVYLKVRLLFDPPISSFLLESANKQIQEYEWRLNVMREGDLWTSPT